MFKRFNTLAVGVLVFALPIVAGSFSASAQTSATVPDTYVTPPSQVIENSGDYSFNIFGATATRTGNNLQVTIYTNYANAVGALSTGLGDLFLANGNQSTLSASPTSFQFAASSNFTTSTSGGIVYKVGGANAGVQQSFYGNANDSVVTTNAVNGVGNGNFSEPGGGVYPTTGSNVPCTGSPCNGGGFRTGAAVGVTGSPSVLTSSNTGLTDNVTITPGSGTGASVTTQPVNNGLGYANVGVNPGQNPANYNVAGNKLGEITFTINGIFGAGLITSSLFTMEWAMTCGNDVIVANFNLPSSQGEVPLPAALPLFASGAGFLGFLNWRRKRKTAAATVVAA